MKALLVYGTRPNFIKVAPLHRALRATPSLEPVLVHTGQHFDASMSDDIIAALEMPVADIRLDVGAGTQAWQIATVMQRLEPVYESVKPDCTIVVGDVSSTLAAGLASDTLGVPVAHVEAGLRSRNPSMPEERNRVLTDHLAHWLFAPSADAVENLAQEAIRPQSVYLVGNVMIDSLDWVLGRIDPDEIRRRYGVAGRPYGVVTLHRPSNVDDAVVLRGLASALAAIGEDLPLLFAVHPRTQRRLEVAGIHLGSGVTILPPVNYPDFVGLESAASLILTDSGGIQEEAVVLGVPCLTLRAETERPSTLDSGNNEVVGTEPAQVVAAARRRLAGDATAHAAFRPPLWDGHTAERVAAVMTEALA
ncbi:MAG TPA: UDP-N-acetylglucosamine 2-epimerase (non-hydrolyzing) [Acidimicrobiales bacterium]|nr:UDP-N-acetylglucosamine 2-epimerase (non-hydrolyzing) [Acidimicrobiales bacterium]